MLHQGAAVEQSRVAGSKPNTRNYITILYQSLRTFRMSDGMLLCNSHLYLSVQDRILVTLHT